MVENSYSSIVYENIGVIGAGAWGTALACIAAKANRDVTLWAMEPNVVDSITRTGTNEQFLPGTVLPQAVRATTDLATAAAGEALLIATPAQHLRGTLKRLAPHVADGAPVVLCAKGIERTSGLLLTEVLAETLPLAQVAILSGPSFARDVANELPTAVTIASRIDIAQRLQASLGHRQFRPYVSDDVIAVALGGAAKNVYAIGCGIADGLGLGESARAALLARSFAELTRLGEAMGGRAETFMGLSGLGDLVLSATSSSSRNFAFGKKLGQGQTLQTLQAPGMPLVEGAETARPLLVRAQKHGVEMPIAATIAAVLDNALPPGAALDQLMNRPLGPERK
jgi:glycerol-3-phosphate dehydrogenase (NAD(P)+)